MMPSKIPELRAATASDPGRVRQNNEDACLAAPESGLFVLSDGMGGHQGGEVASRIVVSVFPKLIARALDGIPPEEMAGALQRAAAELSGNLREQAEKVLGLRGMGATLVAALIRSREALIVHVGDSRAYLYRGGQLRRLTEDHTLGAMLLRMKQISPEQGAAPGLGRLSRYVGMEGEVTAEVQAVTLETGDRLLLCSDGLTGMLPDALIEQVLASLAPLDEVCEDLIVTANAAGGRDNISVVLVDVGEVAMESAGSPPSP